MKQNILCIFMLLCSTYIFAQNAKVIDSPSGTVISNIGGTDIPYSTSILDIRSSTKGVLFPRVGADLASPTEGLLYYNTTGHNFRYYDGTAWQNALFGNQWNVNGTKISYSLGNVGIGVVDPIFQLDVAGAFHTTGNIQADGYVGIGGSPNYKLNIFDGSLAFTNSTDAKTWTFNYNSTNNGLQFNEDGVSSRLNIENGGNVGIGVVNPAYKLDVAGNIHTSSGLVVDGNAAFNGSASVDGPMTVNSGGGVAYNNLSSNNIKIARFVTPQPAAWGTSPAEYPIPAHGSREITITLPAGFTSTPAVMVASQHSTGGDAGELYRAILVIYNCNTTQCTGKIINTDNTAIDYWVRWNLVAMQF